jgi:hypothetical protein
VNILTYALFNVIFVLAYELLMPVGKLYIYEHVCISKLHFAKQPNTIPKVAHEFVRA